VALLLKKVLSVKKGFVTLWGGQRSIKSPDIAGEAKLEGIK